MVLKVASEEKEQTFAQRAEVLLNKYLNGAVRAMNKVDRSEWKETADDYTRHPHGGIVPETLEKKEKELKAQAGKFDFKTRAAFTLNATQSKNKTGLLGALALSTAAFAVSVSGVDVPVAPLVAAAIAYPGARHFVNSKFAPENEAESSELVNYEQIKKTQLALKMLKRAFKAEDKNAKTIDERAGLIAYRTYQGR